MKRLLLVLAVLLLAACGVPQDAAPRALDAQEAPFQVLRPEVGVQEPQGPLRAELWLVRDSRLVAVTRSVESPGSPEQVLTQLFEGPTQAEAADGLSTAIPEAFELEDVQVRDRIAVVTLSGVDESVRNDSNLAFGQIVATLDARTDVEGVRFRTDDGDLRVPRGSGSLTDAAVNRESYAELFTEPGQPTTTTSVVPPPPVEPSTPAPEVPAAPG